MTARSSISRTSGSARWSRTRRRGVSAVIAGTTATAFVLLASSPAMASGFGQGAGDQGLSVIETLLLFVGAPALIFGVIVLLVMGPGMARAGHDGRQGHEPQLPVLNPPPVQSTEAIERDNAAR